MPRIEFLEERNHLHEHFREEEKPLSLRWLAFVVAVFVVRFLVMGRFKRIQIYATTQSVSFHSLSFRATKYYVLLTVSAEERLLLP